MKLWILFFITSIYMMTSISLAKSVPLFDQPNDGNQEELDNDEMDNEEDSETLMETEAGDVVLIEGDIGLLKYRR